MVHGIYEYFESLEVCSIHNITRTIKSAKLGVLTTKKHNLAK